MVCLLTILSVSPVPLGVSVAIVQASLYDVPGGYRAVMFDRFSGVKDEVCCLECFVTSTTLTVGTQATGEGTHFLVPWLQRAILYDCRIKPRVGAFYYFFLWTIS